MLHVYWHWTDIPDIWRAVFGLGRIFRLERLAIFMTQVSSMARAWSQKISSEAMHVYMGENWFSFSAAQIRSPGRQMRPINHPWSGGRLANLPVIHCLEMHWCGSSHQAGDVTPSIYMMYSESQFVCQ